MGIIRGRYAVIDVGDSHRADGFASDTDCAPRVVTKKEVSGPEICY